MTRAHWYRLSLSFLLVVVVVWLWSTRFDELLYHTIGNKDLIELGDATSFGKLQEDVLPNSYVSATGILGNKAATLRGLRAGSFRFGTYQVRNLLGSKLYVEFDQEKHLSRFNPFTRITVQGRLIPFGPGSELQKVRDFFKDYYNMPVDDKAMIIVMDEEPRSELVYGAMFIVSLLVVGVSIASSVRTVLRARRNKEDQADVG